MRLYGMNSSAVGEETAYACAIAWYRYLNLSCPSLHIKADVFRAGVIAVMASYTGRRFRLVNSMRLWQPIRARVLNRHCHSAAYAAVVLVGSYEEAGDQGRVRVQAGGVILHDRFEAHLDRFSQAGAVVLNLPLQTVHSFRQGVAKLADPDLIVTAAERSLLEATSLLLSNIEGAEPECSDWPDGLAAALMEDSSLVLSAWAEEQGLEPWMLSRGFQQVFGISAEAFRARTRARRAWKAILCTKTPLAEIAVDLGFSDQAHMTRSVKQLSGLAPGAWRGCKWIQDNVTSGR